MSHPSRPPSGLTRRSILASSALVVASCSGARVEAQSGAGARTYDGFVSNTIIGDRSLAATRVLAIRSMTANTDLERVRLAVGNLFLTSFGFGGGGVTTFETVAIEYPVTSGPTGHTTQPLTFGGSGAVVVSHRGVQISDWKTLTTTIPKGAKFRIWAYMTMPAGSEITHRQTGRDGSANGDIWTASPSGNTVLAGTEPSENAGLTTAVCPFVLGVIAPTVSPSIVIAGDSIFAATRLLMAADTYARQGPFAQVPMDVPLLNLAWPGATSTSWRNSGELYKLLAFGSTFFNNLGFNDDVKGEALRRTNNEIAALATAAEKRYITTVTPSTPYSGKGWTQLSQSPRNSQAGVNAHNELVRSRDSSLTRYTHVLDVAAALSQQPNSGTWKVRPGRSVSGATLTVGNRTITAPGANFTAADVGYGVSAEVGGKLVMTGVIGAVADPDNAVMIEVSPESAAGNATLNIGSYVKDGVHIVGGGWDFARPLLGLDNPATWARLS